MTKKEKTLDEWQAELTQEQFFVCRLKGTEYPFSGDYYKVPEVSGVYYCVCCDTALFETESQFEAGCGWPSFFQPISQQVILEQDDFSHNMHRTEVLCKNCHAHLGHVFADGPEPTGLRYCINSVALKLKEK